MELESETLRIMATVILEITNQMFSNIHFPTYNNAGYTGTANQMLLKFTLLLRIHRSALLLPL